METMPVTILQEKKFQYNFGVQFWLYWMTGSSISFNTGECVHL